MTRRATQDGAFLAALSDDDERQLRALGRVRRYDAGDAIFHQGDDPGGVVVIVSGRVKITNVTATGKEVILAFRGPGDIVGEIGALANTMRSSAVRAIDPVETLAVGAADFRDFLDTHAAAAMNLVLMLIERLHAADDARVEFASHDVIGRVARRLVELCERFGEPCDDGVQVTLALSQEELAGWTASSREAVAKAMRLLRELGWVETHRRRIVVRDLEALRRYAA
ncbi:MAG: Crp/Fnr family transcriptional regulator [Solirubrobacteraceae bacterium]|nr:Crp/Fnr family transcriptional regulator [Solirubrobacteraceae bacterium]